MVKVACGGCKAPYQIDEKRIPPTGLKMRCPKCGTNLLVTKPGAEPLAEDADLPMPAAPRANAARPVPARAPAKAAPVPSPQELEEDLPELPSVAVGPRRQGFGEIAFGEPARLPGRPPRTEPPRGQAGLRLGPPPKGSPGRGSGGFGEIDLLVDLPGPAPFSEGGAGDAFGDVDLPVIHGGEPEPGRSDMAAAFGDVDLPIVHSDDLDLPSLPRPSSDLPAVHSSRGPAKPRGRTVPFGGVDLSDEAEEAIAPTERAAGGSPFGAIDLPSIASAPALPSQHQRGKAPREAPRGFGEIELPLISSEEGSLSQAAQHSELPSPAPGGALPAAAQHSGLPMAAPGGALPMPAQSSGLPMAAPGGALPMPATGLGMPAARGFGIEPELFASSEPDPFGRAREARRLPGSHPAPQDVGEELSLGPSSGPGASARGAFDDSDRAVMQAPGMPSSAPHMTDAIAMPASGRGSVGDEVELSSEATGLEDVSLPPRTVRPRSAGPEVAPKRSSSRRIVIGTVVLIAVGGASFALEPAIGPFGASFISDQVNAKKHATALGDLRRAAQADLDEDTSAAAARALQKAKDAHAAAPRHRPTAAYCAYVALSRGIRFGRRSEEEAIAKQLLAAAGREDSDALTLATAAEMEGTGQAARARDVLAPLALRSADDPDVQALAGEIELSAKDPDKALAAWKRAAVDKGDHTKSARALFGLARAQAAAGDAARAEASARAAIEVSPQHTGARVLLARLTWQSADREADAITALSKVTEDPKVRGAASDAEIVDALTLLGSIHLARSRMSAAEQAFAAALKLDPQAIQALIGNGELFYQAGRYSEANARFEAAMRADESSVAAKIGTAKTWLALERMKEAKDLLKKLREGHGNDPTVAYWLGRVEEALGNKKEAEAMFNNAIKVGQGKPEVVDAYVALARLLSATGRTDDANAKLLEASKQFPDLPALHKAKGELLLQTGRFEEAKSELSAALAKEDDLGTRFKLGVALRRLRAFDEATAIFDKVAGIDKDYPDLALERGLLFEETGQSARALEMYADALRKAPDSVDLKLRVGSTQVMAGHAEQAEAMLREVVKAKPSSAEANHFLGRALLVKRQNLTEAMRFLETAVNIDGNRAEYHLYVGWCANETGQRARAEVALKRALELDRELADAYWQRGVLLQRQGATVDALADLTAAIEKRPSRFEAYATMALCYQDQQRWPEAQQAFRNAIAGNGAVPEWHFRLGKLYGSHGSLAAAAPALEQAVKLAEAQGLTAHGWVVEAYFLLAEAIRGKDREKAIQSYRRFLELAPPSNPYIEEAQRALALLRPGTGGR